MGRSVFIFVISSFCLAYFVSSTPEAQSLKPTIHSVIEGNNLSITCNITTTKDEEVFWMKNNTVGAGKVRQNGTELAFTDIRREAAGRYICYSRHLTSDANATIVDVIHVDVLYPAEISAFSAGPTVLVQDQEFSVTCNFTGNPVPDFVITNTRTRHVFIEAQGSNASIRNVVRATCETQGTWICTGRNNLNQENVTRSENATVYCPPCPNYSMMKNGTKVRAKLGGSMPLVYHNLGHPYPNYTWSHNGRFLSPEQHQDYGYATVLQLDNIQVRDFGVYNIDMINQYGFFRSSMELVPFGPPEKPKELRYSDVKHDSVRLHWTSGYNMGSPQRFYVLRYDGSALWRGYYTYYPYLRDHGVDSHFEFLATDLLPDTFYKFAIVAQNNYNDSYGLPVSSYSDKIGMRTKAAPLESTTPGGLPFIGVYYKSTGFIVGISIGAVAVVVTAVIIVIVIVQKNRVNSYSNIQQKTNGDAKYRSSRPLELGISTEMRKQPLS